MTKEDESIFSGIFPWWDRLFGTYRDQPTAGHDAMAFGVDGFDGRRHQMLHWMIAHPFLRETAVTDGSDKTQAAENKNAA